MIELPPKPDTMTLKDFQNQNKLKQFSIKDQKELYSIVETKTTHNNNQIIVRHESTNQFHIFHDDLIVQPNRYKVESWGFSNQELEDPITIFADDNLVLYHINKPSRRKIERNEILQYPEYFNKGAILNEREQNITTIRLVQTDVISKEFINFI